MSYLLAFFFLASFDGAADTVQSRFEGPVDLRVWRHWQASWNVERVTRPLDFELERGIQDDGRGYVQIRFFKQVEPDLRVRIMGSAYFKEGEYGTREAGLQPVDVAGVVQDRSVVFRSVSDVVLDQSAHQIVTAIEFEVLRAAERIFHYRVLPMYTRGSRNHYWNNTPDGYMAHAGRGRISIANGSTAESGWDRWDGELVRPSLEFIDFNRLNEGDEIGLHRHERNQEMWMVVEGNAQVSHGMATRSSANYLIQRQWNGAGETREVEQFNASGGWLETRRLHAGEYTVIVPNPADPERVSCHGLLALTAANTFTMGTKN